MSYRTRLNWKIRAFDSATEAAAAPAGKLNRTRQARWDADHMRTASCRLTVDEMDRLRAATKADGVTIYGLLRYMISVYLRQSGY